MISIVGARRNRLIVCGNNFRKHLRLSFFNHHSNITLLSLARNIRHDCTWKLVKENISNSGNKLGMAVSSNLLNRVKNFIRKRNEDLIPRSFETPLKFGKDFSRRD